MKLIKNGFEAIKEKDITFCSLIALDSKQAPINKNKIEIVFCEFNGLRNSYLKYFHKKEQSKIKTIKLVLIKKLGVCNL